MEKIVKLYKVYGDSEYLGEDVSKTTHMIQCAYAAEKNNEKDYIILACLLHDIGHFLEQDNMNGLGVIEHGKVGADYLRKIGMYERVCHLVENHVMAKKYLVSKYDDYYNKLSDASKKTLEYQGGKMTQNEMEELERDDDFENILKIRHYDDIGKQIGVDIPNIEYYCNLIEKYLNKDKYDYYKESLKKNGYLLLQNYFNESESTIIKNFKTQLECLHEEKGKWMIYYEDKDGKKQRSRIENFVNYQDNIKTFLKNKIDPLLDNILEEKMILFKDKMNWKLAGGDGFKPHQDHPAWNDFNVERFYSIALFATESTKENGCLQIVKEKNDKIINENGCISNEIASEFNWEYLETDSRDLLIFDSYIPHKSDRNNSLNARSILYFTYNKLKEGDYHSDYIKKKRQYFPPENERDITGVNKENNKYNLGNPLN